MGKQILVVQGGGRPNGNTARLVRHFMQGAESAGHAVEVVSLLQHEVRGCLGCNACRYGKPCVQKDAFNALVPNRYRKIFCIIFACFASFPLHSICFPSLFGSTVFICFTPLCG